MRAFKSGTDRGFSRLSDRLGGAAGFFSQFLNTDPTVTATTVPAGASWAFLEALGTGGWVEGGSTTRAGGGAGNDAILAVTPGASIALSMSANNTPILTQPATTVTIGGTVVLSASSAIATSETGGAGASGKYPGSAGSVGSVRGGKGGGRLAGRSNAATTETPLPTPGLGSGGASNVGARSYGGGGAICITFFDSYDAALAFAKAVYGGTWAP